MYTVSDTIECQRCGTLNPPTFVKNIQVFSHHQSGILIKERKVVDIVICDKCAATLNLVQLIRNVTIEGVFSANFKG